MDRADLHLHSHFSDGEWSPRQLADSAKRERLRAIALTDHDTVDGIAEAILCGRAVGIEVIAGVEISTWLDVDFHLLGYGFDPENADLAAILAKARGSRYERAVRMSERLEDLGVPVSIDEILEQSGDGAIGRPHVARALVEAGHVQSFREAFELFLGDGKPACVPKIRIDPVRAIEILHGAGGVAVAAHPAMYGGVETLDPLVAAGLDGVEIAHGLHDDETQSTFAAYADAHGLAKTGGSDFHGPGGVRGVGSITIPWEWVEDLQERIRERGRMAAISGGGSDT
jgi:predicted metal-dependent phosphoesterase TrpH